MPVTKVGIVYYEDDKRVFRIIYPEFDDIELDQPPTDGQRRPYLKPDRTPHSWTTLGINPMTNRKVVMEKIPVEELNRYKFDGVV